ncbi:MAG: alanine--tRNA ligase, partial [Chitinophagaceae bacterium]|nr:alanine--tRNA ligase [Chitinophagaceae bacterium]
IILTASSNTSKTIDGKDAFELYDTFGFPIDLTRLIASEKNLTIDEVGFEKALQEQKNRSRAATAIDTEDWVSINEGDSTFVGYDTLTTKTKAIKYRKIKAKGKESYQLVLQETPFYAESGGQVGDKGILEIASEKLEVIDTKKENNLTIHFIENLPEEINWNNEITATVNKSLRSETASNHSATHLLHAALRKVLGTHVAQKGSLVNNEYLRFDFSHFAKVSDQEIIEIEKIVNEKIRENIPVVIKEMKKDEAVALGAMALFGEKYGNIVRVVIIDPNYSVELCGGTHVSNTGELGFFKIKQESAVAAGVRRIEAFSGKAAEQFIYEQLQQLHEVINIFNNPKELLKIIENTITENKDLKKKIESLETKQLATLKQELLQNIETINNYTFLGVNVEVSNADNLKKLTLDFKNEADVVVLTANITGKASVALILSDAVINHKNLDATKIIKEHIAPIIKGGGGGQKSLATAGGQDASNLTKVIDAVKRLL